MPPLFWSNPINQMKTTDIKLQTIPENGTIRDKVKTAAKNIRAELKALWPDTKFSVTSSHFSMGNSISVSWVDGPAYQQVDEVATRYQEGNVNSMEDMYEYDREFDTQYGGSKYVSCSRDISDQALNAISKELEEPYSYMKDDGHQFPIWEEGKLTTNNSNLSEYLHRHINMSSWIHENARKRTFVNGFPGSIPPRCTHHVNETPQPIPEEQEETPENREIPQNSHIPSNTFEQADLFSETQDSVPEENNVIIPFPNEEESAQESKSKTAPELLAEAIKEPEETQEQEKTRENTEDSPTEEPQPTQEENIQPESKEKTQNEFEGIPQKVVWAEKDYRMFERMKKSIQDIHMEEKGCECSDYKMDNWIDDGKNTALSTVLSEVKKEVSSASNEPKFSHFKKGETPIEYYKRLQGEKGEVEENVLTTLAKSMRGLTHEQGFTRNPKAKELKVVKGKVVTEGWATMEDTYGSDTPKGYCYNTQQSIRNILMDLREVLTRCGVQGAEHINSSPEPCQSNHRFVVESRARYPLGADVELVTYKAKYEIHMPKDVAQKLQIFIRKHIKD